VWGGLKDERDRIRQRKPSVAPERVWLASLLLLLLLLLRGGGGLAAGHELLACGSQRERAKLPSRDRSSRNELGEPTLHS
jgi:hypothetical protein